MQLQAKKNSLSREQAMELYDDLEKAMSSVMSKKGPTPAAGARKAAPVRPQPAAGAAAAPRSAPSAASGSRSAPVPPLSPRASVRGSGRQAAAALIMVLALAKIGIAGIEASGVLGVPPAQAMMGSNSVANLQPVQPLNGRFSKEEIKVLTALDERRTQLENRSKKLDDREREVNRREQEFASRITELREMTGLLKTDREKSEKKQSTQIEQLANVYGSMDPKEAAALIEQLDITIALSLIERMPEKRIGQILGLMAPERALSLTKMLSGKPSIQ